MKTSHRDQVRKAKDAIVFHAAKCEEELRLADFAENEPLYGSASPGIAASLRKMAAYSSEKAFAWAAKLREIQPA